jgi:hypothetical protein
MTRPDGSSASSVQMTVASACPGFTVKTRQQPPEAWAGTRTSVTPAGAALELGGGASLSTADDVQAWIETNITKQGNAARLGPFMPSES